MKEHAQKRALALEEHIEQSTRKWIPALAETGKTPAHVLAGRKLKTALEALRVLPEPQRLTRTQRETVSLVGDLGWICMVVVRIMRHKHMLSCVSSNPPPEAYDCAIGVLAEAWHARREGRTWGGAMGTPFLNGVLKGTFNDHRRATVHTVDPAALLANGAPSGGLAPSTRRSCLRRATCTRSA